MIGSPGIFKSQTYPHWALGSLPVAAQLSLHWLKEAVILCAQLSLPPTQGERFALSPHGSDGSKKGCWFFSQFNFLLVVRVEWQFPSSSHAGQDPRNLWFFHLFIFLGSFSSPGPLLPWRHCLGFICSRVPSSLVSISWVVFPLFTICPCYLSALLKSFSSLLTLFPSL